MENREQRQDYKRIAESLINSEESLKHIKQSKARIAYLESDLEKQQNRKAIYGQCEKVPDKFKWSVPFDFTITLFRPNIEKLNAKQIRTLIFHELLHVGIERDGNEENYYVVPHQIEDFVEIIKRYGLEWLKNGQA